MLTREENYAYICVHRVCSSNMFMYSHVDVCLLNLSGPASVYTK
jgi:hypothetical protein